MRSAALPTDANEAVQQDHIVVLRGATWADFKRLVEIRGDDAGPRYAYLEGMLEIMSPSRSHEAIKSLIGRLVEVYCLENDIDFSTFGSWLIESEASARAVEPDECYVFGDPEVADRPDLAIEVVWTSGGVNKLDIYRKLGVREVWYWRRGTIQVHLLRGERYEPAAASEVLPGLDLDELLGFLDQPTTSQAMRAYRVALRGA